MHGPEHYSRHVVPGYGHIDCMFGKNAVVDVYPMILEHLEKTALADLKPSRLHRWQASSHKGTIGTSPCGSWLASDS